MANHPVRSKVNPGRAAALNALLAVERGEHAEDALARLAPRDPADRGLAWHLVLGILRNRPAIDAIVQQAAKRTTKNLDPEVLAALRMGVFELRRSRVPPHAAVDQAVEACRALGAPHAAGFVNAVLRNQGACEPDADARLGHPAWLVHRWRRRYGAGADVWMEANNEPAAVYIVAKEDPAGVSREFQHRGIALAAVGNGLFRLPEGAGAIEDLPGYAEGRWWVMDPAAAAIADLVGEFPEGAEILDACAAPGGKSFRLASRGARVHATDVDAARLERVQEGAERLDLPVWGQVHDWTAGPLDRVFPLVLVDAPCTGLGTLRRHPDIRWRRRQEDIAAAATKQWTILQNAARCVAPGGAIVYAVCSPEPEEGVDIAKKLGWRIEATFDNAPALGGEDVFWGCRMRRPDTGGDAAPADAGPREP
ncbi:MAG: transcription antitermination factor NusB [Pseudomonadota bacterium]|nr:transcription antitermination factor NusB [Pseudomonadota bacterium]